MRSKYSSCCKCKESKTARLQRVKVLIGDDHYKIRCSNCGFETDHFETKEEAMRVWNGFQKNHD